MPTLERAFWVEGRPRCEFCANWTYRPIPREPLLGDCAVERLWIGGRWHPLQTRNRYSCEDFKQRSNQNG